MIADGPYYDKVQGRRKRKLTPVPYADDRRAVFRDADWLSVDGFP